MIRDINSNIQDLSKALAYIDKTLANDKVGFIRIRKRGKHHYLYRIEGTRSDGSRREHYISLKSAEAKQYLNYKYCQMLKPYVEKEYKCLKSLATDYTPEDKFSVIDKFPTEFAELIHCPIKDYHMLAREWKAKPHHVNTFPKDQLTSYKTNHGEIVRSKAEYIIANILDELGLYYIYEMLYTNGTFKSFPDFAVLSPYDHKIYYLEYFGMMDDPEYRDTAFKKIANYQKTKDAARFIYVFESSSCPMNPDAIKSLLKSHFFPDEQ